MKRFGVAVVVAALLLGACGGGDEDDKAAEGDKLGATEESTTSSSAVDGASASGSVSAGGSTATTKPGASGGASAGATTTTPTTARSGAASSSSSKFAAPGNYVYQRTGKRTITGLSEQSLDGEGALRVDAPNGNEQHSATTYGDGGTETTVRPRTGGIDLVFLKVTVQGSSWEFRPSPPVLFAPDPAAVGSAWSWKMTSTDGSLTIDASFKVVRNETVTIGGEAVPTSVVEGTSKLSGAVTGTLRQTLWGSERYRLIVRSHDVTDTTAPFASHAESTSTLRSTKPG